MSLLTLAIAASLAAPATLASQEPMFTADLAVSRPRRIAALDMAALKGEPFRLAWSPDAAHLYVQALEGTWADANTGRSNVTLRHYLFAAADGSRSDLDAPPEWFGEYWNVKASRHAPGEPALRIELVEGRQKKTTTAVPMGGDLAKGGSSGLSNPVDDASAAAYNVQWVPVNTMMFKGLKIGEFVNSVIVPGLTYGWGPAGTNILAFAAVGSGRVTIVDAAGRKRVVEGSRQAVLPAWSGDGMRLAWLQKEGRRAYHLYVAAVTRR
jgi:hypothetical protein